MSVELEVEWGVMWQEVTIFTTRWGGVASEVKGSVQRVRESQWQGKMAAR